MVVDNKTITEPPQERNLMHLNSLDARAYEAKMMSASGGTSRAKQFRARFTLLGRQGPRVAIQLGQSGPKGPC